jgi:hypothetical protein
MKIAISSYNGHTFRTYAKNDDLDNPNTQLVLGFGEKSLIQSGSLYQQLAAQYPRAAIVLCSSAGEIFDELVTDHSVSITAIQFEQTSIRSVAINSRDFTDSYEAGIALVNKLPAMDDLCYILVISDGTIVNGSKLVNGINQATHGRIPVTGGLAGDGANFTSTLVGLNGDPETGNIVAIGFYGKQLAVSHGSSGGWEMFGPERPISSSSGNRLYEINGEPALELYKKYLGPYAADLPGSALLFPLSVKLPSGETVVRTILSIDAETGSMVFAGDLPQDAQIRFMKANFDRLIDAAGQASIQASADQAPSLALVISCVGRKIILDGRIGEEVEAVRETLGNKTFLTGFYSYGEIAPFSEGQCCQLHNQTITITTFTEKSGQA